MTSSAVTCPGLAHASLPQTAWSGGDRGLPWPWRDAHGHDEEEDGIEAWPGPDRSPTRAVGHPHRIFVHVRDLDLDPGLLNLPLPHEPFTDLDPWFWDPKSTTKSWRH